MGSEADFGHDEHEKLREETHQFSEDLEEKYDKKIDDLGKIPEDDRDFSDLQTQYEDLRKEVTELRKQGKDVFYAHNLLLSFPTKLEMAKLSEDPKDLKHVEDLLYEAEKDIHEAKKQELVDVRTEVEQRFRDKMGIVDEDEQKEEVKTSKLDIYKEPSDKSKYFHLYDGEDLKSIAHFRDYIPEMPSVMYQYYIVSEGKNDFAEWVEGVFGAKKLADKIRKIKDKNEVIKIINEMAEE